MKLFYLRCFGYLYYFIKADVDTLPELAERFGVMAMPTFIFLRKGELVDRFSGASIAKLEETIRKLTAK